jgi:3-oxoadipate enol-lactonase
VSPVDVPFRLDGPAGAPPLLLSNSLGTTSEMWDPQIPALTGRYRVVRYDTRGHGTAPVPNGPYSLDDLGGDAVALLDRLGIERAHVVGLSLGGMTGMWLGAHAPERVDRLVLMCTSAMLAEEHDWPARANLVREQGPGAIADATIERWFTPGFVERNPDTVARLRATLADTPPEGYAACCDAIGGMDQLADLERIEAPTLVIAGREDPATPPPHAERIADGIPGARLEIVDAAHLANIERAEEVTRLTLSHLEAR